MLYMLTAVVVAPGGISTVHITHNNTLKQNTLNGTSVAIKVYLYKIIPTMIHSLIYNIHEII